MMKSQAIEPLSPELFHGLEQHLGRVKIENVGELLVFKSGGKKSATPVIAQWGETYRINCPFCGDERKRLYINHRFAEYRYLVKCFNEDCLKSSQRRHQLVLMIFQKSPPVRSNSAIEVSQRIEPAPAIELPATFMLLSELQPEHDACRYVAQRGFDPGALVHEHQIGFCDWSEPKHRAASGRLVVPVFMEGRLHGWIARALDESEPKYLFMNGFKKGATLYNFDRARQRDFAVLVEGVTDVWAVGPEAVAMFGKTLSSAQQKLIERDFKDKPILIMLDGDARRESGEITNLLSRRGLKVREIKLANGADPGGIGHAISRTCLERAFGEMS